MSKPDNTGMYGGVAIHIGKWRRGRKEFKKVETVEPEKVSHQPKRDEVLHLHDECFVVKEIAKKCKLTARNVRHILKNKSPINHQ